MNEKQKAYSRARMYLLRTKRKHEDSAARKILAEEYGLRSWPSFRQESGCRLRPSTFLMKLRELDPKALGLLADWKFYHPTQTTLKLDEREYDI